MRSLWWGKGAWLFPLILAGCLPAGNPTVGDNPYAPAGVSRRGEAVDGLIVGHRLMEAGEYELALKAYYRAAAEHGVTVDVLSAIGSANLRLGRLGQAEAVLRKAIEVDGSFVPAWNNLGVTLMEQRKYAEAAEVFKRAFALDSGQSEEIRKNLTKALATLQKINYSGAEEDLTTNFALVRRGTGEYVLLPTP